MTICNYKDTFTKKQFMVYRHVTLRTYEPRREKTGLRGFRPGPTQTDLYQLRKELEA